MDNMHSFYCGDMYDAYEHLGAKVVCEDGETRTIFRVYAPSAREVYLIGDFNGWDAGQGMMHQIGLSGIYELIIPGDLSGNMYKYKIHGQDDSWVDHTDPYAKAMELRPANASIVCNFTYEFHDREWMEKRTNGLHAPVNIYELHFGSWKKPIGQDVLPEWKDAREQWYNYEELAPMIIEYVKEMGYTHIELLPLNEYPADESWGYQATGFFAPTARYGTPEQLMKFVDLCHQAGIGIIMDFVPGHFAVDGYSLGRFDGTALYEYPEKDIGISEWGSYSFNYYRGEVCSFLQSAADNWLTNYHMDGIRMDAISNVVYWNGNSDKGKNEGGVKFVQKMNDGLHKRHPSAMLIAEDSSAFPCVTRSSEEGGLGFDYKWDMGWMNDTLAYFKEEPMYRRYHHHKLTFSMMYNYSEKFLMPFSHDEDVHGKATILQKMWGLQGAKFSQAKALYMYMITHPGHKLDFMGNEFGTYREWDEKIELDWFMLKYPAHDSFRRFRRELNQLYLKLDALHSNDFDPASFRWIEADACDDCVYMYERMGSKDSVIFIMNMENREYIDYAVGYDHPGEVRRIMTTEQDIYSGTRMETEEVHKLDEVPEKKWAYSFRTDLKPFEAKMFLVKAKPVPVKIKPSKAEPVNSDQVNKNATAGESELVRKKSK